MLSDDRSTDPAWLPIFSKKEHFMGNAFGMIPAWNRTNGAMTPAAVMSLWQWRTADFQRRIYGVLWGSFMKYLTSTAWRTPKKSTIPVLTDLGPHRPEVEKAQRAAPAGCRLLTFPHRTSGKGRHIHALSQRRFSMTQAVTYERETKSVAFQGKIIVLESLTPVLPPKEKAQRKKEIERCLYEVFSKYGDRFP